ncbi:hypothetical protein UVI_02039870 [Ustilaginoidea virens]|nr:hypothetical protein UVI_02039870 [Ustilaginoidea virens]
MKAAVMLAAAAFVRLSLAAPAHAVFKRGEIFNLYQLAVNSFSDQTTKDLFRKNLELLWRPAGPLPISTAYFSQMASEYAARMQSYLDKGLDEQVADALTRLYHSHNSKEYPVEKAYVDDFINKIAATMEGK